MYEFAPQITPIIDHIIDSVRSFRPELAISIAFIGTIFCSLFIDKYWKQSSFSSFLIGIVAAGYLTYTQNVENLPVFFDMLRVDSFSQYARIIILFGVAIIGLYIQQYGSYQLPKKRLGDIYAILLATTLGLHLLTLTTHWIMAFIAVEMVSIGSYVLVAYFAQNKKESEAAMKYVLFGSTCAAFMLYGLSLLYGFTGSLDFTSIAQMKGMIAAPTILSTLALLFVFVGIGFKLGFVPFHVWTPDVYEGAPTPITAFLATVPKVGAIVLFSRLILAWTASPFYFGEVTLHFLCFVAIVTMLIGNLVALRQQNIKRLMAYSSVGHTGFLLLAVLSYVHHEPEVLFFYLSTYILMNLAVFGFIMILEKQTGSANLPDYSGQGKRFPILFTALTFAGISLVGLPPTSGFVAKLLVFTSIFDLYQTVDQSLYLYLLIVGVLTSVISLFYYLKIPMYGFLRQTTPSKPADGVATNSHIVYGFALFFTLLLLLFGLFPDLLLDFFRQP
ncbi:MULTISPECIES: NADH-quinone oxidoreductase subunit N [Sphingobacterium]|uniref:NADH-quinone oxidoreductase subunit N n=1 Tax=Sphingobacterium populi TaxID=1812824 RepID=A0ABW5U9W2_9SPHI|nr:NADH-quinone oxidoreductase subunit N [Sphingobacterium sp. CFCC 11742]